MESTSDFEAALRKRRASIGQSNVLDTLLTGQLKAIVRPPSLPRTGAASPVHALRPISPSTITTTTDAEKPLSDRIFVRQARRSSCHSADLVAVPYFLLRRSAAVERAPSPGACLCRPCLQRVSLSLYCRPLLAPSETKSAARRRPCSVADVRVDRRACAWRARRCKSGRAVSPVVVLFCYRCWFTNRTLQSVPRTRPSLPSCL